MTEAQIREIADQADMIVRGYAFTRKNGNISVVNLNRPGKVMIITPEGKMLESTMDEIEEVIVQTIWRKDAKFMEDQSA